MEPAEIRPNKIREKLIKAKLYSFLATIIIKIKLFNVLLGSFYSIFCLIFVDDYDNRNIRNSGDGHD